MKTETDRKLYTYVTGVNTLDKYKEEHSYHYLPDVIMPPSQILITQKTSYQKIR